MSRKPLTCPAFPQLRRQPFAERESGKSKFSRKILYEGMRFPLKALGKRISGAK